jgi:hypothetical protein
VENNEELKKLNTAIYDSWGIDLTGDATSVVIDGVEDNDSFNDKADRFINMSNALGINQGMPSSAVDMYMYNRRLKEFLSIMPSGFKLSDYTTHTIKDVDFGSNPLHPGNIMKYNTHYFGMMQLFDQLYNEFDTNNKIIGTVNRVMSKLDKGKFDGHVAKKYEHAEKITNKVYIAEFLQGKKAMLDKEYDLDTAKDRTEFVNSFNDFVENTLRAGSLSTNLFVSKLRQTNRKGLDGKRVKAYSVLGMKNMEESEIFDIQASMEKLSDPIKKSLYYYDLIMNGGQGLHSYSGMFDIEMARPLMEFSTKYDLNRIGTKSLSDYVDFTYTEDYSEGDENYAGLNPDRKLKVTPSDEDYLAKTFAFQGSNVMYIRSNGLRYSNIPNTTVGIPFEVVNGTILSNELFTVDRAIANAGSTVAGYYENSKGSDPLTRISFRDVKTSSEIKYTHVTPDIYNPDRKYKYITSIEKIAELTEGGFHKYVQGNKKGRVPQIVEHKIDGVTFEVHRVGKFDTKGIPIGRDSKYIIPLDLYIENKKFFTNAALKDKSLVIPYVDQWSIEGFTSDDDARSGRLSGEIVIDEDAIPHNKIGEILENSKSKDITIISKRFRTPAEYIPYVSENPNSLVKNGVKMMGFDVNKAMPNILSTALPYLESIVPHDINVISSLDLDELEVPNDMRQSAAFMHNDKAYINRDKLHLNDSAGKLLPALIGDKLYILEEFSNLHQDKVGADDISAMEMFVNTLDRDIISTYVAEDSEESRSMLGAANEALNSIEEYLGIVPDATIGSVLSSLTKNHLGSSKVAEKFEAIENAEAKLQKEIEKIKKLNNVKEDNC